MTATSAPDASPHSLSRLRVLWEGAAVRWKWPRALGPENEPRPFAQLRRRLISTNILATSVVLLIISVAIYLFEANLELAQIDRQLAREASSKVLEGLPSTPMAPQDTSETPYDPLSSNFFSIVVARGGVVVQDNDQAQRYGLPDWNAIGEVITGVRPSDTASSIHSGFDFRTYTAPIISNGAIVGAVQSGMSLDAYHQQLQDLVRGLVALDLFIALLMLGSSVYLTNRALKPARIAFERQRQFAAGASHELRTPLALIRSLAELVVDHRCVPDAEAPPATASRPNSPAASMENQESVTADAQEIIHEVDYMTRLVTDLLLLARDEHDRRALNWVIVDLRRVMQGVVEKIAPLALASGIMLSSDLTGRQEGKAEVVVPALVEGDPDRLRELALVLLENAVRYTPHGGSILVTLDVTRGAVMRGERHGHVTFAVRDTGVGIAPDDQAHVFEPFYRATSTTLRRATNNGGKTGAGSGLGLALAHWIVEAHHGEIRLSSQPGKGATFTVELPLIASTRPTTPPSRATPRLSHPT